MLSYDFRFKPSRSSKVWAAKDHGKKFRGELAASFNGIVNSHALSQDETITLS